MRSVKRKDAKIKEGLSNWGGRLKIKRSGNSGRKLKDEKVRKYGKE